MREEEKNQPTTEGQTDEQRDSQKPDAPSLTQPATDDSQAKDDERTGEGTGSRAGEYS